MKASARPECRGSEQHLRRPAGQFSVGLLVPPSMSPEPVGSSMCSGYGATPSPQRVTCKVPGVSGHWASTDTHGLRFWKCLNRLCWGRLIINVLSFLIKRAPFQC